MKLVEEEANAKWVAELYLRGEGEG
jgi:hypothetical protein